MPALAALASLVLVLETLVPLATCDACVPEEACAPHAERERDELPGLVERYRALAETTGWSLQVNVSEEKLAADPELVERITREFAATREEVRVQREEVLRGIAALNRVHGNAPSRGVTQALAEGLGDFSSRVRLTTASLLVEGQHAETASQALCDALAALDEAYDVVGKGFEKRWKRLGYEERPLDEGFDVRGIVDELRERIRWSDLIITIGRVGPGAIPPLGLGMSETEYRRALRKYERDKATAERQRKKAERNAAQRREALVTLAEELVAAERAFAVAPGLVDALRELGDARAQRALARHFEALLETCPTHSLPAARALLADGARSGFEQVARALRPQPDPPQERIGPADVSASSYEGWRRALHDALAQAALARGVEAPAWSDDAHRAWADWLEAHGDGLDTTPGG